MVYICYISRDCFQILLLILSKFERINFYSTQNESKLINSLKLAEYQNQILQMFPKETYEILYFINKNIKVYTSH